MRLSSSLAENLFFLAHICFWCHELCLNPDLASLLMASSSQKMDHLQVEYSGKWSHSWRYCLVDELNLIFLSSFYFTCAVPVQLPMEVTAFASKLSWLCHYSHLWMVSLSINISGRPVLPVLPLISDYCMSFMTERKLLCSKEKSHWKVCVLFYLFGRKLVL